jgi:hypothetical protein
VIRVPGFSLLRTCRDIHAEAIGILYVHNNFLFRRIPLDTAGPTKASLTASQVDKWLEIIEHQARLVDVVEIDITNERSCGNAFDLLSLLKLLTRHRIAKHVVSMTMPGPLGFDPKAFDSARYNASFQTLLVDPFLHLRSHIRFPRLGVVGSFRLSLDGTWGDIQFEDPAHLPSHRSSYLYDIMEDYCHPKFRFTFDVAGAIRHSDNSPTRSANLCVAMSRFPSIRNGILRRVILEKTRVTSNLAL